MDDLHARRREIVFAVCFVESYLFEWARDDVLNHEFAQLPTYFPLDDKRGIRDRWKEVLKALQADGRLNQLPSVGDKNDEEWVRLVLYRDGLIHASSSRPESSRAPPEEGPRPSASVLNAVTPGWAVGIVEERARRLHACSGTQPPEWL
jgi:hypothetical protein